MSQPKSFLQDTLRRDDFAPPARPERKRVLRVRWTVRRGEGGPATHKLYSAAQAKRFVRLARRFGVDCYATQFGKVWIEE